MVKIFNFLNAKIVFTVTIIVTILTIISIWLLGLKQHQSIFINAILSTSILSSLLFLFLTIGLYRGFKLKHIVEKSNQTTQLGNFPDLSAGVEFPSEIPEIGEGIEGIILGIIGWIVFSICLLVFVWFFGTILFATVLFFTAMLYWVFFRALRLVFKHTNKCKGSLTNSFLYGLSYTLLYTCWIYGIILASHYLNK